jgi:tetratricopeptide (TPR) repeat protein
MPTQEPVTGDLIAEASRLYAAGHHGEAAALATTAVALHPADPAARHLLGLCHIAQGRWDEGVPLLQAALAAQPDNDELRMNLVRAQAHRGEHAAVVELLEHLLLRRADLLEAYQKLAFAKWELNDRPGAIAAYRRLVEQSPFDADAHRNLGHALMQTSEPEQASAMLRRALDLAPDNLDTHVALVEAMCEAAMRHPPGHPDEERVTHEARTLIAGTTDPALRYRLGIILHRTSQLDEAAEILASQHAELTEDQALSVLVELANIRAKQLRLDETDHYYREALALQATDMAANVNLSLLDLLRGRFAEGWPRYESRLPLIQHLPPPPTPAPEPWRVPERLDGTTVRVVLEQGLGDTLQFIRYVPLLAARGATIQLAAPIHQAALPLLHGVPGIGTVVEAADTAPVPAIVVPLLSLPLAFGTDLASIPAAIPYLAPPEDRRALWRQRLAERTAPGDTRPRIGVVWSGSPTHANDRVRSIPLARFRRLLQRRHLAFHTLADRLRDGDAEELGDLAVIHAGIADFADTAALVEAMDLVVAVDTSVAHLAGALGKPVWVMVAHHPDFRWLLDREDSPWYPTLRLFRQPRHLDWESVLDRVGEALDERYR